MKAKTQKNYGSNMFNKNTLRSKKDALQKKRIDWILTFIWIALSLHGRWQNADILVDSINLILLPRIDTLTRLIIEGIHRLLLHSCPSHTHSQIRNKYWIPKERTDVKKILKKFPSCERRQGDPYNMKSVISWTKKKVRESTAFKHIGFYYFGPLHTQKKRRK